MVHSHERSLIKALSRSTNAAAMMVLFRRDLSSSRNKSDEIYLGFGYKFLNLFCNACGHTFESNKGWCALLMMVHQVLSNLAMASFLLLGSYNLYISLSNFSTFLYFCAGFFTIVECVFRTAFIIIRSTLFYCSQYYQLYLIQF